jgi:formylglycine-generating enzyme required for sulfatase activity
MSMKRIVMQIILIFFLFVLFIPNTSLADDENILTSTTIGAKFVLIPAGTFAMGSPSNEPGRGSDETLHQVTISKPFYIQTTELTQGQWQKVMGSNPSYFKDCGGDCPVERVSWNDVQDFIRKLNKMEGIDKYRLPTEAEWEYAARSGGKVEEYAGTNSESALGDYAWYNANSGSKTHTVGQKLPNSLGLYDMSGNVWEWVQDWYGDYLPGSVTDPVGPSSGSYRVFRGGSWLSHALLCRATSRNNSAPELRRYLLGFRLVKTP